MKHRVFVGRCAIVRNDMSRSPRSYHLGKRPERCGWKVGESQENTFAHARRHQHWLLRLLAVRVGMILLRANKRHLSTRTVQLPVLVARWNNCASNVDYCFVVHAANLSPVICDVIRLLEAIDLDQQLYRAALGSIRFGHLLSPTCVIGWNIGAHANPLHRKNRGGRKGGPDFANPDKILILLRFLKKMVPEEDSNRSQNVAKLRES